MCDPTSAAILTGFTTVAGMQAQRTAQRNQARMAQQQYAAQQSAQAQALAAQNAHTQRQLDAGGQRAGIIGHALAQDSANAAELQNAIIEAARQRADAQEDALKVRNQLTGDKLSARVADAAAGRGEGYSRDLEVSAAEGLQDPGSGVQGNVSQSFSTAGEKSKAGGIQRAQGIADQVAYLGGFKDAQFDESALVRDVNVANGLDTNAANAADMAARMLYNAQRQQTNAQLSAADLVGQVAPPPNSIIDVAPVTGGGSNNWALAAALGQGALGYLPYMNTYRGTTSKPSTYNPSHIPPAEL